MKEASLFLVGLLCMGCGSGGSGSAHCGGDVYSMSEFADRARAVEECIGLDQSELIGVTLVPTVPCPTSGRRCCLADRPAEPCGDGSGDLCGRAGEFDPECEVIRLPDECTDALEHELVHALRYLHGYENWAAHDDAVYACQ